MSSRVFVSVCALQLWIGAFGIGASAVEAQEPGSEEETVGDEFGTPAGPGYTPPDSHEMWHVENRIEGGRITLITSAIVLPVSALVFMGGAIACSGDTLFGGSCSKGENAAMGLGGSLFILSTVGLIAGAVLLGVSKKRKRELGHAGAKLRWDARTSHFVF